MWWGWSLSSRPCDFFILRYGSCRAMTVSGACACLVCEGGHVVCVCV
jgi:hypothetical protein